MSKRYLTADDTSAELGAPIQFVRRLASGTPYRVFECGLSGG